MKPTGFNVSVVVVSKSEQVAVRLEPETLAALDALAVRLSKQGAGIEITRAQVIRAALGRGIELMTAELGKRKSGRSK